LVPIIRTHPCFAFLSFGRPAVLCVLTKHSLPPAAPGSDHLQLPFGRRTSLNRFAASTHHRKQRFYSVNAIPEKIGMMRFRVIGAGGFRKAYFANRAVPYRLSVFPIPQ